MELSHQVLRGNNWSCSVPYGQLKVIHSLGGQDEIVAVHPGRDQVETWGQFSSQGPAHTILCGGHHPLPVNRSNLVEFSVLSSWFILISHFYPALSC